MSNPDQSPFDPDLVEASLKWRSLHGAIVTLGSQAAKLVLQFASLIVLARLLDPEQFGIVAMVSPVFGFVQVFNDLGLTQAVVQRREVNAPQLTNLFWISILVSLSLAALLASVSPLLGLLYHEPRLVAVNCVMAGLILINGLNLQQTALLNRRMRFSAIAMIEIGASLASVAAGIFFAMQGAGYWAIVLAQVAFSLCYTVLIWSCSDWRPSLPTREVDVYSIVRFGSHITGSNVIGYLNSAADNMMVGAAYGSVALGLYDRSYRLVVVPLQQVVAPIGRVALPLLARLHGSDERFRRAYLQMIQAIMCSAIPGLVFAIIASKPLIMTLLGEKWADITPIFVWMCISAITMPVVFGMFWLLISQGRSLEQLRYGTITAGLSILAYAAGLPWGVIGVVKSAAFYCWVFQAPFLVWVSTRSGCVRLGTVLPMLLTFLLTTLMTGAVLYLVMDILMDYGRFGLALGFILSYTTFFGMLFCTSTGNAFFRSSWILLGMLRPASR
jgi:PST family polysaccharide transporter